MISLAKKTIEEINDIVQRGSVLIYSTNFQGVINKESRHYLVTDRELSRNKRIYRLVLYHMKGSEQVIRDYDTSALFQHRTQYHVIPTGEKK